MFPTGILFEMIYVIFVDAHKIPLFFALLDDFVCHAVQAVIHFSDCYVVVVVEPEHFVSPDYFSFRVSRTVLVCNAS